MLPSGVLSQGLFSILPYSLDDHEIKRIHRSDLEQPYTSIELGYDYADYYRRSVVGKQTDTFYGYRSSLEMNRVDPGSGYGYGLFAGIYGPGTFYSNEGAHVALNSEYEQAGSEIWVQLAITNGGSLWGAGIRTSSQDLVAPVAINSFPTSEDEAMNLYLLDWLEPSFGSELSLDGDLRRLQTVVYGTYPGSSGSETAVSYRYSRKTFDPALSYVNNSNINELQGSRRIIFDGETVDHVLEIEVGADHWEYHPGLNFFSTRFRMDLDNRLPEMIRDDFADLGWFGLSRLGGRFSLSRSLGSLELGAGAGMSRWAAATELTTPVLGRYILLPVAHALEAELAGWSRSLSMDVGYLVGSGRIRCKPRLSYAHGYFDLRLAGVAALEFNIRSVPIDYPLQFHLHVLELRAPLEYVMDRSILAYSFHQVIPWLKRVDDSPLKFKDPGVVPDDEERGGGYHEVSVTYFFRERD